jgi:hypothetical protein
MKVILDEIKQYKLKITTEEEKKESNKIYIAILLRRKSRSRLL